MTTRPAASQRCGSPAHKPRVGEAQIAAALDELRSLAAHATLRELGLDDTGFGLPSDDDDDDDDDDGALAAACSKQLGLGGAASAATAPASPAASSRRRLPPWDLDDEPSPRVSYFLVVKRRDPYGPRHL